MRVFRLLLGFMAVLFLICGLVRGVGAAEQKPDEIKIVASFYPMYITARNIVKNVTGVTVSNLTPPMTGCLHDYTVTTDDMKKLVGADVFVANGAGMESFLDRIVTQYPLIKVVLLSAGIPLIKGDGEEGDNPHVWVSISDAMAQARNLGVAMQGIDPVHAEQYQKNTEEYLAKLETLRQKMQAVLAPYKGEKIITFHEAFPYFAQEFGLEIAAVVEREPGSEPSAKDLADTIDLVKKVGVRYLFSEPQYPDPAAKAIARETGAVVYVLDPVVTGPDDLDAYVRIMERNLSVLNEAFSKK